MIRTPEGDLEQELKDPEYVKLYGASDAKAEIAITLAEVRHAAKKTQKEVADAMSLSQPYVARLEGGEANPTIGTIGSLLAVMGFRLVTGTAPLKPEPMPSSVGTVLMGAADPGDALLYLQTSHPSEEIRFGFETRYDLPINVDAGDAGIVSFTTPIESIRSRAREVVVGGAAK